MNQQEKPQKVKKTDAEAAPNPVAATASEKVEDLKQAEKRRPRKQTKQQE
jgi:hypothetical protein